MTNNNKFNRFTHREIEKVEMEFLLMAVGHRGFISLQSLGTEAPLVCGETEDICEFY